MSLSSSIRRRLAPLYYRRFEKTPDIFRLYETYRAHDRLSRQQLLDVQFNSLQSLLLHACHHTRYYRRLFHDCGFDPNRFESLEQLNLLPILTKETINANYSDLIADNVDEKDRHVSCTGGTSGVRMNFLRDNRCRARRFALQWRSDAWTGWEPGSNVAYVWPAAQDLSPRTTWKQKLVSQCATGVFLISAGVLNETILSQIAADLCRIEPALIRCFPSAGTVVAQYLHDHHIALPGLRGVVSAGESVSDTQRNVIESGFGAPVFNLYASREVGTTAAECSQHRHLHIAVDSQVVEIVTAGKRMALGEFGDIVITDLLNYAMPMIRYAIGDYGSLVEGDCPCGLPFPLLENVVGRTGDNLRDCDGKTVVPNTLTAHLIVHGPRVGQVQVIQNTYKEVLVRMSADPAPDQSIRDFYSTNLKILLKGLEEVRFEVVDHISYEESGKYRFTICNIPPDMPPPGTAR